MIYLDNASTTPIDPEVLDVMIDYLKNEYGNPSSKYYPQAISAQEALKNSRKQVAALIGCEPEHVIFTSGATESNNFIIKGVAEKYKRKGNHIITSKIEHKSVLETSKHLEKQGYTATYVSNDELGRVNVDEIEAAITDDTILVSIMWGNNEIGTLNDIEAISQLCKSKKVLFHTDATQVIGKIDVNVSSLPIDFLSMSGHKIYGPKGVGVAYVGPDKLGLRHRLPSLLDGGGQEYTLRAGTHSMHNIVGLGKAAEVAKSKMNKYVPILIELEKQLKNSLLKVRPDITFNGDQDNKIPGLLSINIPGINNELFSKQISESIAISTGSACSIGEGSYVLSSLHINQHETLRITLNKYTDNINEIIKVLSSFL
ncbi:IscS subfamily cysteine desulfurase [Clostridium sediminicola]|uniref:cysteine desulfurase family protein n=1 Tax=Clostridium sediminicola TaxID=3114879 RepID=UPI0031F27DC2